MKRWLVREGPVLVFLGVATAATVVMAAGYRRMTGTLESTVSAVDNLTQARVRAAQALLALARAGSGDPTVGPGALLAEVDRATAALDDLSRGRSSLLGIDAAPFGDAGVTSRIEAYAGALGFFRDELASADTLPDFVSARLRGAELEGEALALEAALYEALRARLAREAAIFRVGTAVWLAFVGLALGAFLGARRTRDRAVRGRDEAEERYAALATHAEAGLVRTDRDGRVVEATEWWLATFARDAPARGAGLPWWTSLPERERTRVSTLWAGRAARGGEPFSLDVRAGGGPDGATRWLGSRWVLDEGEDGEEPSWIGTFLDETEERALADQLRRAQRLEVVGRLTGGIAHDFNNLLAVVLSNAELLADSDDVGPEARELVEEVESAARSGRELVAGLTGFSREAPLDPRSLDLAGCVRESARLARRLLPETVELEMLETAAPEEGPVAIADARAVQQILLNLVSNARDAMADEGGHVRIEVDAVDADEEYVDAHPWVERGRYGRISVSDDGAGMDPETAARIFDPFFTTKPEGKGTGLGLSTVHGLVRQHGGHVHVYSEPGQGTTFRIYLPRAPAAATPVEGSGAEVPERAPDRPGAGSGLRVLLVDDEELLRRTARRVLARLGHEVVEAADGREALDRFAAGGPFDLVITDVRMRAMGGVELFRSLRERGTAPPFLFTSGYTAQEMAGRSTLPSGAAYLAKPWTIDEMKEAIRTAC